MTQTPSDAQRELIASVWLGRAAAEAGAAQTFRVVADCLRTLDAEPELVALARRAVGDELRHAELCWEVARHYGGDLAQPAPTARELPHYDGASEELICSLHVVGQCCLNETTAGAFLERCLQHTTAELPRKTFLLLLSDEVDHARLGWAHLASPRLSTETRAAIAAWLPSMIARNLRVWRARPDTPPDPVYAQHGALPRDTVVQAVTAAVDELLIPGLAHVGIRFAASSGSAP